MNQKAGRRYSLSEIDRMRAALQKLYPIWFDHWTSSSDLQSRIASQNSSIEEKLRTYMMGGVGAEELEDKAARHEEKQKHENERIAAERTEALLVEEYGPRRNIDGR